MKEILIPASKSISNRLLILNYLFPAIRLENLSTAKDTEVLQESLRKINEENSRLVELNIGHAGTAMRFLTALLSSLENREFILDGSERMRNRPIGILVDALRNMGAEIVFLEKEGFPPLRIKGKKWKKSDVVLPGSVSSQYITALLLVAPSLPKGLKIQLDGEIVSKPYIDMTLGLLSQLGIKTSFEKNLITVESVEKIKPKKFTVEGDWSSASYFYGKAAVTKKDLVLKFFTSDSLQGDQKAIEYFSKLGIETHFLKDNKIQLKPIENFVLPDFLHFDLLQTPDLAQTLAVTCAALKVKCKLTGLQTLKIKETDRLEALYNELTKFGIDVFITEDSLEIKAFDKPMEGKIRIETYDDHRMAMSFAILKEKYAFEIANPEVVVKSFPDFWEKF